MKKTFAFVLLFFLLYFLVLIWLDIKKFGSLNTAKEKLEYSLNLQQREKQMLVRRIKNLDNSDNIDMIARRKLGLVKKGETAFKIVD